MREHSTATWTEGTLGDFCSMYQPKTISMKEMSNDGKFPVYGANGQIGFYHSANHMETEVTVSCRGNCGTVNVIPGPSWITGNAMVVQPIDDALSKNFLHFLLMSLDYSRVITGTAQQQITRTNLTKIPVAIPPIDEQQRIVEILEEIFSKIEIILARQRNIRSKAARFRRSLLHAAFTGVLTGHDSSAAAIPSNWSNVELGKIGRWITGSTPFTDNLENFGGATPFITPGDISDKGVLGEARRTLSEKGLSLVRKVNPPSILLVSIGATLGKVTLANQIVATNQQINSLEPNMELIIPRYLELLLSSQAMQEQLWKTSTSTTVPIINKRKLESLNIDLPPKIEQEVIVSIVEEQLSHLEKSLINVDEIERKSAALKRSLLHSAFTGELTKEWRGAANV